MNTTRVD